MEILILRPKKGQIINNPAVGITGRVFDIYDFEYVYGGYPRDLRLKEERRLMGRLGDDAKEKYFQAVVLVYYAKKDSEYQKGDIAILNWDEFQSSKFYNKPKTSID